MAMMGGEQANHSATVVPTTGELRANNMPVRKQVSIPVLPGLGIKAVHDKVSTSEINLRKKPLPMPAYTSTGAQSEMRPAKLVTIDEKSREPMRVTEKRPNSKAGETEDPREYPPTRGIVGFLRVLPLCVTECCALVRMSCEYSLCTYVAVSSCGSPVLVDTHLWNARDLRPTPSTNQLRPGFDLRHTCSRGVETSQTGKIREFNSLKARLCSLVYNYADINSCLQWLTAVTAEGVDWTSILQGEDDGAVKRKRSRFSHYTAKVRTGMDATAFSFHVLIFNVARSMFSTSSGSETVKSRNLRRQSVDSRSFAPPLPPLLQQFLDLFHSDRSAVFINIGGEGGW
ncbi:hypothetical protein PR048_023123 [Dryococelus australis]|uniref:Uncharacterized protein n=1 Tax=Dryococelus australis TaxID=614101 RepID=A0ABQ9GT74_9NEOP|nr:hypothetical protein PR048_023123 [Dryococelus australis]